jgi:hypothetical protein
MSTTIIPECPPLDLTRPLEEVLRDAHEAYSESTRDSDKASDTESHEYHSGAADAYRSMIMWLTGVDLIEKPCCTRDVDGLTVQAMHGADPDCRWRR